MLLPGCTSPTTKEHPKVDFAHRVPPEEFPSFEDDLDRDSLKTAVERSLSYFHRIPGDRTFSLGDRQVSAEAVKASLLHFLSLLETDRLNRDTIAQSFDIYSLSSGDETKNRMLVTGYYEPILEGRLVADGEFCYPVYAIPSDLLTVDLADFDPGRFPKERLVGRVEGNRVIPYHTRALIDGENRLVGLASCLVWLKDPIEAFFLHVQGSGMIQLADGRLMRIGYAGSNGRPYRSVGKLLLDKGVIPREEMSLQSIRTYLRSHPEIRNEVLWYNESYVFFRWVDEGPVGSLNVVLTAGRSVATDARYYPRGGLAFLQTEKPKLDANGEVAGWEPLNRWVLNQDTGGAIKGSGRVDLFCGTGEPAERIGGRLKHPGKLYFLMKKDEVGGGAGS